jgi:hypothetical protein
VKRANRDMTPASRARSHAMLRSALALGVSTGAILASGPADAQMIAATQMYAERYIGRRGR